MPVNAVIKKDFIKKRDLLFRENSKSIDSLDFSMQYSLLVEDFIRLLTSNRKINFAIASAGSFSRRELAPYSDIDLIFINESLAGNEKEISEILTLLWDNGIEVSQTLRDFGDISKFLKEDLHSFTQFFETRLLWGSEKIYNKWNELLLASLTEDVQRNLIYDFVHDIEARYEKFGSSAKTLEPNIKLSAGGLRDFQVVEWMYILKNKEFLNKQNEKTQSETFVQMLLEKEYASPNECRRLLSGYKLLITVRNLLHLMSNQKNDRLEFAAQQKIAPLFYTKKEAISFFMRDYFIAANTINRFTKSIVKKFLEEITNPLPDSLAIDLDEDFILKGKTISLNSNSNLDLSDILRAFYYRGSYNAQFDEKLRTLIVETVEKEDNFGLSSTSSSVFFREILRLPKNVGQTLSNMNELGVLGAFMPEFKDLIGFLQHGVYHQYTADEHTLMSILNVEKLEKDYSNLGKIFNNLKDKEILYLSLLFHDIAKPINISGHEIIGAEMASSIMYRLGYSEDVIEKVSFLVKNHLYMEQVAFRRNLNDPETLNNFTAKFASVHALDLLYLVTYADLSAVNPAVWTSWKSDLLAELYRKTSSMLIKQMSGEELLISSTYVIPKEISKLSPTISESHVQEHIDSINDISYVHHFTDEEIARHVEEIQKGTIVSTLFKELNDFTNITIITKDFPSLLSKICGVLSINDANIHDAKIFTRKDGIVIDTFNVSDFRTGRKIEPERFIKIEEDLNSVIIGMLQLNQEFSKLKNKWWRIESKFFKRTGKIRIAFENHEKYTIIDVFSPDRLGFLYQVTSKMNELGLSIYFAKIATNGDDIVDSFYVLERSGKKVSVNEHELIKAELTDTITQLL
ncbi:MAG: HD domain-containing protein [Ignavibacteriaceae bacterium]|nr:HD domain-containing protein [Ignavibacteriaceae bacterium]